MCVRRATSTEGRLCFYLCLFICTPGLPGKLYSLIKIFGGCRVADDIIDPHPRIYNGFLISCAYGRNAVECTPNACVSVVPSVSLSVRSCVIISGEQNISKSYEHILIKFCGQMGHGLGRKRQSRFFCGSRVIFHDSSQLAGRA